MFMKFMETREAMYIGLLLLIPVIIEGVLWINRTEDVEVQEEA